MSEKVVVDRFIEYSKTRSIGSIFFLLRDVKGKYILRYFDTRQMGSTIHSFSCLEVLKTLSAMPPGASFQWHPQRASCAEVIGRNRLEGC